MVYSLPGVEVSDSNKPATVKISHRDEEERHIFHWEFTVKFEVMKNISLHSILFYSILLFFICKHKYLCTKLTFVIGQSP